MNVINHPAILSTVLLATLSPSPGDAAPLEIGSRLQLFVDDYLVEELNGGATYTLHNPTPREVVLTTGEPWEGNTCAYYTVFRDGDRYRLYYRGSHYDEETKKAGHREVTCYAESRDGVHWEKPKLGLFEWDGSKDNNIVWDGIGTHNFTPFKDGNPACPPEERYKALGRENRPGEPHRRLFAFKSPDGIHWSLMSDEAVITQGAFDSQNLAFWDSVRGEYREYHRTFHNGVRDIQTSTTQDFLKWPDPVFLEYPGAPKQHLYTNAVQPYFRAPHLFVGFPTRFLPAEGERVEPVLMTSRDGRRFRRWNEPVIPESAPEDRAGNRSNYMAWGMVQVPDKPAEISVYATEAYYTGPDTRLRRFTYRTDGFVSLHAGPDGGEMVTKPLVFTGKNLEINFETAPDGEVRVELQDIDGSPVSGFSLEQCERLTGDHLAKTIAWTNKSDLGALAGQPVRLRIALKDAHLYALRFR